MNNKSIMIIKTKILVLNFLKSPMHVKITKGTWTIFQLDEQPKIIIPEI